MCKSIAWFLGAFVAACAAMAFVYGWTQPLYDIHRASAVFMVIFVFGFLMAMGQLMSAWRKPPLPEPFLSRNKVLRAIKNGNQRNTQD